MRKIFLLFAVLLLISNTLMAQDRTITGTVVSSDKNEPLIGVAVQVKGSNGGTTTDLNGRFSLKATNLQSIVVGVRYIGYAYQEKTLKIGEMNADFKLVATSSSLDEVVVVGYGEQKKIHLTGAISTIDTKQIQDIPTTNLASALRNQLPGVSVAGGVARPGDNASITIRNPVYLSKDGGSNQPLYIIDDVQRNLADFNSLDQTEVESISVLKDAAAAIYGIRGDNGVIVVRTKRGRSGAPKVTYSGSVGLTDATQLPEMMTSLQQATYLNDFARASQSYNGNHTIDDHGYIDGSSTNKLTSFYTPDELAYFADPANSTNWLKKAWQTSYLQRHALSVSGGSDKVTYFAGATYISQNSNFKGVNTDRWTYRASADANVAKGLKVSLSVSGSLNDDTRFFYKQGSENADNDVRYLSQAPQWTQYYINGLPALITPGNTNSNNGESFNFFEARKENNYTQSKTTVLNVQTRADYDVPFLKGLKLSVNYNKNINNFFGKQFGTSYYATQFAGLGENHHIPGGDVVGSPVLLKNGDRIRLNPTYTNNYQLNGIISFNKKIGKHEFSALALVEQSEVFTDGLAGMVEGVVVGGYDNQNFAIGTQTSVETTSESGRLSYAGRLNYSYDNKYLVELSYRADANTNFPPENQWGYFPSASIGWVASEEGFFKRNIKFIDLLKIRASVGLLGNDNTKPFQYQENYNFAQQQKAAVFGGNGDRGLAIFQNVAIANRGIRWDSDLKNNVGLDMQFLNNRLGLTVDGFLNHHYNMLQTLNASVPLTIGASTPPENYASINSFGYEISVSWKDRIGKDFSYYVSPFLAWSDDKILKIDQAAGDVGTYRDLLGRSDDLGFLGLKSLGMFRTPAEAAAYAAANPNYTVYGFKPTAGMLYYQDVRGARNPNVPGGYDGPDGKIDDNDMIYLTNKNNNHYSGGFNFGGSYKNFSVSVVMGLSWGGATNIEGDARSAATATSNRPAFWADHWTPENTDAKYPSPYFASDYNVNSDFWMKSTFQFRMTNLNLSYTFPTKISGTLGVGSIRAFLNCVNPLNLYNPYDYRDNGSIYTTYPVLKSYTFGLNVGF
ncbi:SusC/RagA family TonB-linked outer membrane protein [Mucilaginibacter lappiensis]|jgi:TonB-linked SusC/RagA family outer membrane protein|uniref:SusC/RagA family TonB-linked outer membrane protein n=1 Tax=Mucilaginibacter lappiensis TaxID=354630 RepID=UPI003D1F6250